MPANRSSTRRPLGVTLLALACFISATWSFAAAALPSVFYGGTIPGYPPLVVLKQRMIEGHPRLVGAGLTAREQDIGAVAVGAVLLLLGGLLWKRARLAHLLFLAALWVGSIYYAVALWRSPLGLFARSLVDNLSSGIRLLLFGNLLALVTAMVLLTFYLWRRREAFGRRA